MRGNLGGGQGRIRVGVIVGLNVVEEIWNNFGLEALCTYGILKKTFFSGKNLSKGHLTSHFMF